MQILLLLYLGAGLHPCSAMELKMNSRESVIKKIEAKRGSMGTAKQVMVTSAAPLATKAGLEILKAGGNAMDAYIAALFTEQVVASGYTSLAGTMGLLYYDAKSQKTYYLDAGFNIPKSLQEFDWNRDRFSGKSVLIPGTVAGLESASKRFGQLPWKNVLAPSIRMARSGFALTSLYADSIKFRRSILEQSDYGKQTFFVGSQELKKGDLLKQPIVAETLEKISTEGSQYMYRGSWAREFIKAVHDNGGDISVEEMHGYQPQWVEPLKGTYRGYEIQTAASMSFGGINLLLSLKILENLDIKSLGHWTKSPDALSYLVKIYRAVQSEPWITSKLADREFIERHLTDAYAKELWRNIQSSATETGHPVFPGTHSGHIVVVDKDGNIATGTHTIESLPWGDNGIFVGGIPLNSAAPIALGLKAAPGGRMREAYAPYIVFKDGKPILAAGAIASSLYPCNLEVLVNILDFGMNLEDAVLAPRFGMFSVDLKTYGIDKSTNLLDKRFNEDLKKTLQGRGLKFDQEGQSGFVDTGMWFGIQIDRKAGSIYGMSSEWLDGLAQGW